MRTLAPSSRFYGSAGQTAHLTYVTSYNAIDSQVTINPQWPHNTGPLMHYMAKCDGSCSTYDSTNAEWFKISELGLEADGSTWYQAGLSQYCSYFVLLALIRSAASRAPVNVTIPSTLAPGNYLLRAEIISLQLAMSAGGAEFYPACIQLQVGGSQTQGPTSSEECLFPGCYSDTDPGILTPNVSHFHV